jgi:hypothetical protein
MLTMSPLTGRAGLRLDGEADLTIQDELQKALAALPPGAAEIHFELAGLNFIDVAAARALIARTLQPPHPRLILHYPPPSLQRLIHLLWPDSNAQFRFSPDSRFEDAPAAAQAITCMETRRSQPSKLVILPPALLAEEASAEV